MKNRERLTWASIGCVVTVAVFALLGLGPDAPQAYNGLAAVLGKDGGHTTLHRLISDPRIQVYEWKLLAVVDGRTIDVESDYFGERPIGETPIKLRVRLIGIDVPELGQPGSKEATRALEGRLWTSDGTHHVTLEFENPYEATFDSEGSALCFVNVVGVRDPDVDKCLFSCDNGWMVEQGFARVLSGYPLGRYAQYFRDLAETAKPRR
jgi:endonuclease YncB( thermonuclease family)